VVPLKKNNEVFNNLLKCNIILEEPKILEVTDSLKEIDIFNNEINTTLVKVNMVKL
jgi:hypothetical protein